MQIKLLKGTGTPIFCLHGWGQNKEALELLGALLQKESTPYLIDLPGFGGSAPPKEVWGAEDYADALVKTLDQYGISQADFLGHSFGGKVAATLAFRHPERVRKLILIASAGLHPTRSFTEKLRRAAVSFLGKGSKLYDYLSGSTTFETFFIPRFGSRDYQNAGVMRPILVRSVNEDLSSILPKIKTSSLILWGEKDMETPIECGRRFAEGIHKASFCSFPYHGHQLIEDVGAHLCAKEIRAFLKGGD